MIAGIAHLTMEADLKHGIGFGRDRGFEVEFVDDVELPAGFEDLEDEDPTLPLALLAGSTGIRFEVVQHRWQTGNRGAYAGIFRCPAPMEARPVSRPAVRDVLRQAGALLDPACVAMTTPSIEAWFEAAAPTGGLAGVLCYVRDVRAEAEFWSRFARTRWTTVGPDAAWASMSSPVLRTPCAFVLVRRDDAPPMYAMNDSGFPSIGVLCTAIEADCRRALSAGATLRSAPIVTEVGGRALSMALIGTPGGAPVELLAGRRDAH